MSAQSNPSIERTESLPRIKTTVADPINPRLYQQDSSIPAVIGGDYRSIDDWDAIDCSPYEE